MNENETSTAVTTVPETTSIQKVGKNLEVVASTPTGLGQCQVRLMEWMRNKITFVKTEITTAQLEETEMLQALEHAKKQKWQHSALLKAWEGAKKRTAFQLRRLDYYLKLLTALESGYFIVPPMDMEIFAIRTDKKNPMRCYFYGQSSHGSNFEQSCEVLPAGEGEYKDPQPHVETDYREKHACTDDKTQVTKRPHWADKWQEIEFPLNMIKPQIMEATTRAMAIKVFDELGVLPQDHRRNPDPVIIGRIYEPTLKSVPRWKRSYQKCITFMVAWHLNTKDL
jgi:hypothetical protein